MCSCHCDHHDTLQRSRERLLSTRPPTFAGALDAVTTARSVVIVPGYGLAVASAQYAIADLVKTLTSKDIKVRLAAVSACCVHNAHEFHGLKDFPQLRTHHLSVSAMAARGTEQ